MIKKRKTITIVSGKRTYGPATKHSQSASHADKHYTLTHISPVDTGCDGKRIEEATNEGR